MGSARFTYRVRVSAAAERALLREWGLRRWVWNQCIAESKAASRERRPRGPAGLDDRLTLAGGIAVHVVWSRELPPEPSSVRVYRDTLGHWYASFVVQTETQPLPQIGAVLGVDWGVKEIAAATTSKAYDLPHPQFGKQAAVKLARYQRQMARRKPEKGQKVSAGYKRAKRQAAKTYAKAANRRRDTARKWAKRVVRDHDAIAVEDFKPRFLAKSTMARKAADASIGAAKRALVERTFTCGSCGTVLPRDRNSAAVMLVRAGLTPAGADRVRHAAA
jgi:putative transposase